MIALSFLLYIPFASGETKGVEWNSSVFYLYYQNGVVILTVIDGVLIILSGLIFFYKLISIIKEVKVMKFLKAMFTKYNTHRYILLILLKLSIVYVYVHFYFDSGSIQYLEIIQYIEPFVSALTLYVLVHTSFVSANDILVTFGGMIVASPPDPKRAILKSVLKRRNLARAPLGVAPLVRDHLAAPVNIQGGNALAMNRNDTPTIMIKKPVGQK
jgi:hypothetical protein